ncbi:MAG: hypothetical protein HZB42_04510 [Sphingobacteriales bacterium]|nr:hypothetical protein [Sphingobacteriales bacterium]
MKHLLIICHLAVMTSIACAQSKTETFTISIPPGKVSNSLYRHIGLLDIRNDTTDYGVIQKGAFNRKERVITEIPFSVQFATVVDSLVDNTAASGELLLILRQLRFAEITGSLSERGYFHFRGSLFAKENDRYQPVAYLDTVIVVSALDVTKKLFKTGSDNLFEFIRTNLRSKPANGSFTIGELWKIDSIEKSRLPLYTTPVFKDGAYKSFESLVSQTPDNENMKIDFSKNGSYNSIQLKNKKNKYEEIELSKWFALVYQGRLCIVTTDGIYAVEKRDNDFYFIGKAWVAATGSDILTAQLFFGLIGGLAASGGSNDFFELKIDHLSGGFIQVRPAKQKEIKYFRKD